MSVKGEKTQVGKRRLCFSFHDKLDVGLEGRYNAGGWRLVLAPAVGGGVGRGDRRKSIVHFPLDSCSRIPGISNSACGSSCGRCMLFLAPPVLWIRHHGEGGVKMVLVMVERCLWILFTVSGKTDEWGLCRHQQRPHPGNLHCSLVRATQTGKRRRWKENKHIEEVQKQNAINGK